jgi:GH15 family glucan-1,4-alpha-glucosidase
MPKSINFGNGEVLIGLDYFGQVKDMYFHYPGLENHVGENFTHKIGIFVESNFTWLDDPHWNVKVGAKKGTMASDIVAKNTELGLELRFTDVLYNEENVFLREITVQNNFDRERQVKLFFNQQFNISETHTGDTAYYDPRDEVVIHYKGRRVFLVNAITNDSKFNAFSIGLMGIEDRVGTFFDAQDGILSGNPIEHGQVDSVIGIDLNVGANSENYVYYWICIAKSVEKAKSLNEEILGRKIGEITHSTINYWKAWVDVHGCDFADLKEDTVELFNKSLLYVKTHTANNGAIIASGDSEMLQFGRDYYRYVWPRDASFTSIALILAKDFISSKKFFEFSADIIAAEGYFMHKYRPDKSIGSSWHPWIRNNKAQFPIQEDETALVIYALYIYYQNSRDIEFIEVLYNKLIKKAAMFMAGYLDGKTGLPKASYDLWEQEYGISTFTASTVYGALNAASKFAEIFGKTADQRRFKEAGEIVRKAMLKYLYDKETKLFYKSINTDNANPVINKTVDMSSIFGIYKFGVLDANDTIVSQAFDETLKRLEVKTEIGGIARYEGDMYHFKGGNYPGNPWIITSMWLAQYYTDIAKTKKELSRVRELLEWVAKYQGSAGTLPEQIDPQTGEHLSASPLVWSHAEYITTIVKYLEKIKQLEN